MLHKTYSTEVNLLSIATLKVYKSLGGKATSPDFEIFKKQAFGSIQGKALYPKGTHAEDYFFPAPKNLGQHSLHHPSGNPRTVVPTSSQEVHEAQESISE